jgi:hypothetical protein
MICSRWPIGASVAFRISITGLSRSDRITSSGAAVQNSILGKNTGGSSLTTRGYHPATATDKILANPGDNAKRPVTINIHVTVPPNNSAKTVTHLIRKMTLM